MAESTTGAPVMDALNDTIKNGTTITTEGSIMAYSSLYFMALFCIYLGSLRSADFVRKNKKEEKLIENSITWKDAKKFPITASCVLFSLYVIFKYNEQVHYYIFYAFRFVINKGAVEAANFTEATLNATAAGNGTAVADAGWSLKTVLSKENFGYFIMILLCYEGCFALAHLLKPFISKLLYSLPLNKDSELAQNMPYQMLLTRPMSKGSNERAELINWEFDTHDMASLALCSIVGIAHVAKRHWITNNIIGVSFCLFGIENLHLASFKGGVMLLAGLFVYDVFWVFATDVMSTVATSIQAPILLMFPQDILLNGWAAKKYAMLGLGDIVIPGIFLALLLRFGDNEDEKGVPLKSGRRRIYFYVTVGAYCLGLILTIGVMHYFKAAQPALLYLVPACVGAPALLAVIRGETKELWGFTEEHLVKLDEEEEKQPEEEEKKTQ